MLWGLTSNHLGAEEVSWGAGRQLAWRMLSAAVILSATEKVDLGSA